MALMRHQLTHGILFAVGIALLASSGIAASNDASVNYELSWKSDWPKFRPVEYVLTGVIGAASIGAFLLWKPPEQPHWTGGILFDEGARNALRLRSPDALKNIRRLSDVTALSSVVLVLGVDSILVPMIRSKSDIALQLVLMDAEAFAYSTLITTTTFNVSGRARPSYAECQRNPDFDELCNSGPTSSFPSGHGNASATAAGLSCAHHTHLALYGNKIADAIACGTTVGLALATSTFRVLGDRHYVSDVFVGSALGFGIGYAVPTLLHYTDSGGSTVATVSLAPMNETQYGLAARGEF
jgi:membrane-associated phospholipid phosphatase